MHTLLQRKDEELNKRIYNAQKNNPSKGDWIEMVQQYFIELGIPFNDKEIMRETKVEFKSSSTFVCTTLKNIKIF